MTEYLYEGPEERLIKLRRTETCGARRSEAKRAAGLRKRKKGRYLNPVDRSRPKRSRFGCYAL